MSIFPVPSLQTIVSRVQADYQAAMGKTATIRRSFPYALSRATAGVAHGLYGLVSKAVDELHPWTARTYGVLFWAAVLDVQRTQAVAAVLSMTFTGSSGTPIPAGTKLVRDDGAQYTTSASLTVGGGGSIAGAVVASEPGEAGNCDTGTTLTLSTPISGVSSTVTVASTTTPGADLEALDALKTRYLERLAARPQGGADADYVRWAREIATVDRVFVAGRWAGEGTVLVRFLVTGDDPIPASGVVSAVAANIDAKRPVCAVVTVAAPATTSWGFYIDLAIESGAVLATVQAAVYDEIRTLFRTQAEPGGTIKLSNLDAAISRAAGESSHVIMGMTEDGGGLVDAADLEHAAGTIPILEDGGITWV